MERGHARCRRRQFCEFGLQTSHARSIIPPPYRVLFPRADFDGLLDALGLAQTSAPQLLATLISSALAKDDWEHIIDREFYMTNGPVYSKALTLLGWKE
jgi:hypothetical protein